MQPKKVFVPSSLKARFLQRACFRIYPSYAWKNGNNHGTAPRQINCFQSNQYLAKTNRIHHYAVVSDETVITRLRISHSRMTHSDLLSRESQPVCDHCKCHLTVKHMLLECPSTAVIRHKYISSTTLKELFSNVDARCILDFTKESGFYQAI